MRKKILISCSSFRSIHNFTPKSNHLLFEVCDSVGSSKLRWRGWSHAACVPSETPDTRKTGKRVPKHERRAMVECFVNKYRSENAGKFPAIKYTQKEVGGCYYVIREIIQELEYKSKMKSSNSMGGILVEKQFDQSKRKTAKSVNVSSGNIETAKDRPIQDDSHMVLLDGEETAYTGCEHLEEKRGLQTSSWEGRLSNEVESTCTPKHFKEPSSLLMSDDVKTEEAVSSYADSVSSESQLLQEETESFSIPSRENHGHVYAKIGGHESEMMDLESHKKLEEICAEKESYERREHLALEDVSGEASHSSPQVPNDVKSMKADSSCPSDYVSPEEHLLKEEIEKISAPLNEKSGSKDQTHDLKFLDRENHPTIGIQSFEKVQFERKVQQGLQDPPGVDSQKHKKEQSQVSSELDESKIGSSNKRETSSAAVPREPTLWGNLKSFADGIINIWRKL